MSEKVFCIRCRYFKKKNYDSDCKCKNQNNKVHTWEKIKMGIPSDINKNNDCKWYIQK